MYSVRSRNQELNTYINSFIDLQYQPFKMFCWRIIILSLFVSIEIAKDYQNYHFNFRHWFSWSPLLIVVLCLLTINFQSLCLGSMSYQYRHHDTPFQIAKNFSQLEYSPLINGLEHKVSYNKRACDRSYLVLLSLAVALLALIKGKNIFWQITFTQPTEYIAMSIYALLIVLLISIAVAGSMLILGKKRQIELIELSLFWIKSASNLRYIN